MRVIQWLLLVVAALFVTTNVEASSFRQVMQVQEPAKLYVQPTVESEVVRDVAVNEWVTVFSKDEAFAAVQIGATTGYIQINALQQKPSIIKIASSKSGLVVKENPSRNAKTVATLQYNMIVEDFGSVGNGWSFVQYGNVTGYVASSFIGVPKTSTLYVKYDTDLYNIASASGAVQHTVAAAEQVLVHATLKGWSYVSAGNARGYMKAADLMGVQPDTAYNAALFDVTCTTQCTFQPNSLHVLYAAQQEVVRLVNIERAKHGVSPLKLDWALNRAAQVKSYDMRKHNYFNHTSPTFGSPFEMIDSFGLDYWTAGENIARGYYTAASVVNGWMNSPGHRANILNESYTHIGVGYSPVGNVWTQIFIGK